MGLLRRKTKTGGGKGTNQHKVRGVSKEDREAAGREAAHAARARKGAAAAVHGMTGTAFQRIPYTPDQVAQMEQKGKNEVDALELQLESALRKIEDLKDQDDALDAHRRKLYDRIAPLEKVVNDFENVPNSGVTETEYMEARKDLADIKSKSEEMIRIGDEADAERNKLISYVQREREELKRMLMEDPAVRYTEASGGKFWRQHIDANGNMGGLVADGANVSPGAYVDMDSRVSGNVVVPDGVQVVNSEVSLQYSGPTEMDHRTGKIIPQRGYFIPKSVTLDESVSDSIVGWKAEQIRRRPARGDRTSSGQKVVRPKLSN